MADHPEINGKPAAKVHVGFAEKIGLPQYSNVDYSTSVTRFVEDDVESIQAAQTDMAAVCETFMSEQREAVVNWKGKQIAS